MITRAQIDDLAKNDPKGLLTLLDDAARYELMTIALICEKLGEIQEDFVPTARIKLNQFITANDPEVREGCLLGLCTLFLEYFNEEDMKAIELCLEDKDIWVKKIAIECMEYIHEAAAWRK